MLYADGAVVRAVIFDMDGLMIDTEKVALQLWKDAGKSCGWELRHELLLKLVGQAGVTARKILAQELGPEFPYDDARAKRIEFEALYYRDDPVPLKPGLLEILDLFKAEHLPLAVSTSTPRPRVDPLLKKAGIFDRFDSIICGDEVVHPKPDPEICLRNAERLGMEPAACLVLEDSRAGIAAAHAAGTIAVMVPDVLEPDETSRAQAVVILPNLHEVARWLVRL